ncbi:MAG TPA: PAS domain S-box protein, partial [Vineibacter sp.]|nr:PAS domain S-box protein [Vineibacter sp.]
MAIWTMNGDGAVGTAGAIEGGYRDALNRLIEAIGRDQLRRLMAVALLACVALTTAVAALTIEVAAHDPARWTGWVPGALAICVGALMAMLAVLWRIVTIVVSRRQAAAGADARHARLDETFDAVPFGIALYDRDERLVAFNAAYNRMIGHIGGLDESMIGRTYDEILTHLEGQLREMFPDRDLTGWKSQYLDRFRRRETADLLWEIGKTVRLMQVATASGGTALLRIDVSDLKRREEDAQTAQRRFDRLVNTLSDTVYSTDREGRFNYLSGAVTQLLGYRPEELLGQASRNIVHPDDHTRLAESIDQLRRNRGRPVAFEFRGQRKDGVERRMEVRMTALGKADNLDGEFAVTGAIRDIHEQHVLARSPERQLRLLDALVQSTGATMVLIDRELRVVIANQEFMNAVPGRTPETVLGRHMRDVIRNPPDDAIFAGWFAAGPHDPISRFEYENRIRDAQGREHFFQVTANPVRDASGRIEHIVILGVDNTDRRAAELQLFDSARLATVGEMAAGVAHELNQPLTIMRLAAESLLEQLQDTPP